jgi:hypothetical protein
MNQIPSWNKSLVRLPLLQYRPIESLHNDPAANLPALYLDSLEVIAFENAHSSK